MKVYELRYGARFDRFSPVELPPITEWFCGQPRLATWKPSGVKLEKRKLGAFDIQLFLGPTALIMTRVTAEKLRDVLKPDEVELLPQPTPLGEFLIGNVVNIVDCLDRDRTVFHAPSHAIEYHVFCPGAITGVLFKTPESRAGIFVPEYTGDPKTEFKAAVEYYGLKGIKFDLLWEE